MDLSTGYLLLEEVADDRTYATWKALVDERLKALGTGVLYLVSDRAKALIQLAEQGLECLSMPDFFHVVHELIKSYSLAHWPTPTTRAPGTQDSHGGPRPTPGTVPSGSGCLTGQGVGGGAARRGDALGRGARPRIGTTWKPSRSRCIPSALRTRLPRPPPQVASHLQAAVEAIDVFAQCHQLPARPTAMTKVRKQLPALAALVDFWWEGVRQDLAHAAISRHVGAVGQKRPCSRWSIGSTSGPHALCPQESQDTAGTGGGASRRLASMRLTQCLPPQDLKEWQAWATHRVSAFQRASSAVEGRNGALSQLHHNQRGLPKQRYKVWTVLHNFDCRAADGTTPAARFFRRTVSGSF